MKHPPGVVTSAGEEAADLAESVGLDLDDWQRWWLEHALAENKQGQWAAREAVLITGRQSGKNAVLAALELYALDQLKEPLVIHSAHELPTALAHFNYMLELMQGTPDIDRKIDRVSYVNGKEAIFYQGGVLQFRARGRNSGRGLTAGRLVFDEAFKIPPESMGALVPTMRAITNSQIIYASSAPKFDSQVLHSLIKRGRSDRPKDRLFYAEWGNPIGTDLDDETAWAEANPALGIRVSIESMRDEYRTLVTGGDADLIAEFAREAVGIGEEPISHGTRLEISAFLWADIADRKSQIESRLAFAVDVAPDAVSSSIAGAGVRGDGRGHVEIVESAPGTRWVCDLLAAKIDNNRPSVVAVDAAGPVNQLLPEIRAVCKAANVRLVEMPARAYAAACGEFVDAVKEKRVAHIGQDWLNNAVAAGRRRAYGDAWMWDRRVGVDVSPLVAVTVARRASVEAPAEGREPMFAFS